jgi:hypothetical protein
MADDVMMRGSVLQPVVYGSTTEVVALLPDIVAAAERRAAELTAKLAQIRTGGLV